MNDGTAILIILGVLIMFVILCVVMVVKTSKIRKENKLKIQKRKDESGAYYNTSLIHATGLPVSEGTLCDLFLCPDKVEIECNGNKFNLDKSKITDVSMKTDVEIQKQYVSSAGGAIAGAVMFGALGAIIGGRAKEKKSETIYTYLIFTYKKDEELNYISFDVTQALSHARKFVSDFKTLNKEINTVNL